MKIVLFFSFVFLAGVDVACAGDDIEKLSCKYREKDIRFARNKVFFSYYVAFECDKGAEASFIPFCSSPSLFYKAISERNSMALSIKEWIENCYASAGQKNKPCLDLSRAEILLLDPLRDPSNMQTGLNEIHVCDLR